MSEYLNKRVRILDEAAPIFHRRKGRIRKVQGEGDAVSFTVFFEGGYAAEGFKLEHIEFIPEEVHDPNDKRTQVERIMAESAEDFDCWVNEALAAFNDAKRMKEKELKRNESKKKNSPGR